MKTIELNPTGFATLRFVGQTRGMSHQLLHGNKRGVIVALYERQGGPEPKFVGEVTYTTEWLQERPFTRVYEASTLDDLSAKIRAAAENVLPPGAGYPATEQYAARQAKLRAQMELICLDALAFALNQAALDQ